MFDHKDFNCNLFIEQAGKVCHTQKCCHLLTVFLNAFALETPLHLFVCECVCVCLCCLTGGPFMWITEMVNWISRESLAPLVSVVSIDLYQKTPLTNSSTASLTWATTGCHYISHKEIYPDIFQHSATWAIRHLPQSKVEDKNNLGLAHIVEFGLKKMFFKVFLFWTLCVITTPNPPKVEHCVKYQ